MQKNFLIICLVVMLSPCRVLAQTEEVFRIDTAFIHRTLTILAADSLAGRAPFTPGITKAAKLIRENMQSMDLQPMYSHYNDSVYGGEVNLAGILPGKDSSLSALVVGAHYDHIGIKKGQSDTIANGANDNASGVAVMLALAKYFAENKFQPSRNIIFAGFTLEENGLHGSRHLARRWLEEKQEIYAVVNFDMLGAKLPEKPGNMFVTGFNKSEMSQLINTAMGDSLLIDLPFGEYYGLFRMSDNYPFYQVLNIPSHTFSTFNFENYPYYHQVGDEVKALDLQNLYLIAENLIEVIQYLATTDQLIQLQE